jgi:hypothetical protein
MDPAESIVLIAEIGIALVAVGGIVTANTALCSSERPGPPTVCREHSWAAP